MNTVVYKPFKRNIDNWEIDPEATYKNDNGRKLILVKIGVQQIVDSDTGRVVDTTPVTEYVYEDILRSIFTKADEYSTRICLGCTPQLVVTYENRLVIHNEDISKEMDKIMNVAKGYDPKSISESLVNSLLNYNTLMPLSKEYRSIIKDIDSKCDEYYSPDFVGLVLRELFFEQKREITGYKEDIHYMSSVELRQEMGKQLKNDDKDKLNAIKDELFYAFLLGDIIPNPKMVNF